MKALILKENGIFEANQDYPIPNLKENDVLVEVTAAGICSSDIPRSFNNSSYFYPAILGHEIVGRVGGQHVAVYPLIACGVCPVCKQGQLNLCIAYDYIGSRRHGGFAEHVSAPAKNIIPLPSGLTPGLSVLVEPVAVLIHALNKVKLEPGNKILIVGDGAMALLLVKILAWRGFNNVSVLGKYEHKLNLANEFGAQATFSHNAAAVNEQRGTFDVAFELAGSINAYESAIALLKPKGQWVLISNIKQDFALSKKDFSTILRKELCIVGSWNSLPDDWLVAAEFLLKHPESQKVISHTFSIDNGPEAMKAIYERTLDNYIKAAFIF